MNVRYSARAYRHLDRIHDHINQHDTEVATRVIHHIRKKLRSLEEFPVLGHSRAIPGMREIVIPRLPFITVYRIVGDTVIILGVYHSAQKRRES